MNTAQANNCLSVLTELFPLADLQEAELKLFREAIMEFEGADVLAEIQRHRLVAKFNRPTFAEMLANLRRSPWRKRIDREAAERATVQANWAEHQREVDDLLASIHPDEIGRLAAQFDRENPSPSGRPRTIDPKIHRAFREWLWTWVRRDTASKEIVK